MAKIIAFEEIGEVETYDLEVEHKDHQYYLANGVLTSNSHAVAYSAISFQCAWLLTYYPAEWLSAYLNEETESKLEAAIAVVKQMGYTVHPPNINISTDRWEISKDGTELYQPLTDVKGFGDAAYEQIVNNRPFKTIEDFLFNEGIVRAKVNKAVIDKLVRSRALDPLIDDRFAGSKHFWNAVAIYRPDTDEQLQANILDEAMRADGDFPTNELVAHFSDLTSIFPIDLVVPPSMQKDLEQAGVRPIGDWDHTLQYAWVIPREKIERKTKKGKPYWILDVVDSTFKMTRIKIWSVGKDDEVQFNRPYIIKHLEYDPQWGFSTPWSAPFSKNFALVG